MSARIAIVGCGIIGATIAYELSRSGKYCIDVFDRQQPAQAATGAALGVLMGIISQKVKGQAWQLREHSIRRYRDLIPELERATGLTIPHTPHGLVKILADDSELVRGASALPNRWQQLAATRAQQQWQLELWDGDRIAAKLPQLNCQTAQFAIYSPQDLQVDPIALTMALVAAARANGVNFHFDRPIAAIEANNPDCCELLAADLPQIDCDWAIVTAGLGATDLLTPHTPLANPPSMRIELQPVLGQAMQIRPSQPLGDPQFQPVIIAEDVNIVPCGGNEYWVGATVEFPLDKIPIASAEAFAAMQAIAFKTCPALAQGEIVRTWTGLRPRPIARPAPVIDRVGANERILVATGHYRNGILLAPATARLIGEMLP